MPLHLVETQAPPGPLAAAVARAAPAAPHAQLSRHRCWAPRRRLPAPNESFIKLLQLPAHVYLAVAPAHGGARPAGVVGAARRLTRRGERREWRCVSLLNARPRGSAGHGCIRARPSSGGANTRPHRLWHGGSHAPRAAPVQARSTSARATAAESHSAYSSDKARPAAPLRGRRLLLRISPTAARGGPPAPASAASRQVWATHGRPAKAPPDTRQRLRRTQRGWCQDARSRETQRTVLPPRARGV